MQWLKTRTTVLNNRILDKAQTQPHVKTMTDVVRKHHHKTMMGVNLSQLQRAARDIKQVQHVVELINNTLKLDVKVA